MKIYLAGGFRSGWQQKVIISLSGHEFLDPSAHGIKDPIAYTRWDLDAIRSTDAVMAYMERDNPAGYSLALEVSFAHALGKKVILIEEHADPQREKYFAMVRAVSDLHFPSIETAIDYLTTDRSSESTLQHH